jgi:predicted nucleic acid-binding protein
VILLDTSAIYALADRADPNHPAAVERFRRAIASGQLLTIHSYIAIEAAALLRARLGLQAALSFLRDVRSFERVWVDERLHELAVGRLARLDSRTVSLVDCTSFVVMEERGLRSALAFDPDFERQGFQLYGSR